MKNHSRYKRLLFALLGGMSLLFGCHNNPIGSGGSIWTQGVGVINVNHFYASGGNLLTSTYCAPCSQAYIYISTDEGSTWNLDTSFAVYNHIRGAAWNGLYTGTPIVFISNGKYLLAGVGDCFRGAIYRSSDNGITWSDEGISWPENDSDLSDENINCFTVLNGIVFAGTDHGIFVSTHEGTTWRASSAGIPLTPNPRYTWPVGITDLVAVGGNLFASNQGSGIYRSTNGGASWTKVDTTEYSFYGFATIGSQVFAAAFNNLGNPSTGGVFVSKDNGNTWQRADADLPDHGVNTICAGGSNLFVGTNAAVYFSSDLGVTWTEISNGAPFSGATVLWTDETYLFANCGGPWRYPLFLLPKMFNAKESYVSQKSKR
ncbi:MAG: WD40/YVTN/BNR-like repeat-containing protein [Candidatus Kryptoniota bacterium]